MRRDHSKIIFRTVVFAGAMLGSAACGGKAKTPEPTTPQNQSQAAPTDPNATPTQTTPADPANPCNPCNPCRARGGEDEEGGMGRGFILS